MEARSYGPEYRGLMALPIIFFGTVESLIGVISIQASEARDAGRTPDPNEWLARFPDVAYDSVDGKYLVVWVQYSASPAQIRGRFVSGNGDLLGIEMPISTSPAKWLWFTYVPKR